MKKKKRMNAKQLIFTLVQSRGQIARVMMTLKKNIIIALFTSIQNVQKENLIIEIMRLDLSTAIFVFYFFFLHM